MELNNWLFDSKTLDYKTFTEIYEMSKQGSMNRPFTVILKNGIASLEIDIERAGKPLIFLVGGYERKDFFEKEIKKGDLFKIALSITLKIFSVQIANHMTVAGSWGPYDEVFRMNFNDYTINFGDWE